MAILFFVLLLKISFTRATLLSYEFTRFIPPCAMTQNIYYNVSGVTKIRCGRLCHNNPFGTCGRFVWESKERACFLHSTRVNKSKAIILTEYTWMIYSTFLQVCHDAGYDFDPESNTCLKYHKIKTGVTWKQSRARCQQNGGDLISIQNRAKWDFVTNYVLKCDSDFWVGLKDGSWNRGEDFVNVFGVNDLLNNYDSIFNGDQEMNCGALTNLKVPIQDQSCNIRLKTKFLCEIILL